MKAVFGIMKSRPCFQKQTGIKNQNMQPSFTRKPYQVLWLSIPVFLALTLLSNCPAFVFGECGYWNSF